MCAITDEIVFERIMGLEIIDENIVSSILVFFHNNIRNFENSNALFCMKVCCTKIYHKSMCRLRIMICNFISHEVKNSSIFGSSPSLSEMF